MSIEIEDVLRVHLRCSGSTPSLSGPDWFATVPAFGPPLLKWMSHPYFKLLLVNRDVLRTYHTARVILCSA